MKFWVLSLSLWIIGVPAMAQERSVSYQKTMDTIKDRCLTIVGADGDDVTVEDVIEFVLGPGISYDNVSYQGILGDASKASIGIFENGDCVPLGFEHGIMLSSGTIGHAMGPNSHSDLSAILDLPGDPDLDDLIPEIETFDASWIEFDFIPDEPELFVQYIFASEEYNQSVNTRFNDLFAIFVNGKNAALIPGQDIIVAINNVNNGSAPEGEAADGPCRNCEFYIDNADLDNPLYNIEADGMTTVLTARVEVNPGVHNTIKLSIADTNDPSGDSWVFIKAGSFSNSEHDPPEVLTADPDDIETNSAMVGGNVLSDGDSQTIDRGVIYGTDPDLVENGTIISLEPGLGEFSVEISDLIPFTDYYVRAYASNHVATSYGQVKSFKTLSELPQVTTSEPSGITALTAIVGGEIIYHGEAPVTRKGVLWGQTSELIEDGFLEIFEGDDDLFEITLDALNPATLYYVRAFAENAIGKAYGDITSFMTQDIAPPEVVTAIPDSLTPYSAFLGGEVLSDGESEVTERGIYYCTEADEIESGTRVPVGSGLGEFGLNITDFLPNTEYFVVAYAINEAGMAYGEVETFKTPAELPEVSTFEPYDVSGLSAIVGGNILDDGGSPIIHQGVLWGDTPDLLTDGHVETADPGDDLFEINLDGLDPTTLYYVRAFAENIAGLAYGKMITFKTPDLLPIIPNAFMPSSTIKDNQTFRPVLKFEPESYSLKVFNRWGKKIFETKDYEKGWDGYVNNSPAPAGGYVYKINFTDYFGEVIDYSGVVMLIR